MCHKLYLLGRRLTIIVRYPYRRVMLVAERTRQEHVCRRLQELVVSAIAAAVLHRALYVLVAVELVHAGVVADLGLG